jgi:hypothetical protein
MQKHRAKSGADLVDMYTTLGLLAKLLFLSCKTPTTPSCFHCFHHCSFSPIMVIPNRGNLSFVPFYISRSLGSYRHAERVTLTLPCRHLNANLGLRIYHPLLYHSGNIETSIHGSWEDSPPTVIGYRSDDAAMEAVLGKVSKGSL